MRCIRAELPKAWLVLNGYVIPFVLYIHSVCFEDGVSRISVEDVFGCVCVFVFVITMGRQAASICSMSQSVAESSEIYSEQLGTCVLTMMFRGSVLRRFYCVCVCVLMSTMCTQVVSDKRVGIVQGCAFFLLPLAIVYSRLYAWKLKKAWKYAFTT